VSLGEELDIVCMLLLLLILEVEYLCLQLPLLMIQVLIELSTFDHASQRIED